MRPAIRPRSSRVPNDPANGGHVGIPVTIYNATNLTSAGFTLTYNANILTVTGGISDPSNATASFQMTSNVLGRRRCSFGGHVRIHGRYAPQRHADSRRHHGICALFGAKPVPGQGLAGARQYHRERWRDGLARRMPWMSNAYFGDVNGDHHLDALDKGLIANVASTINSGFTAFTLLDPAIIGDLSGDNAVTSNSTSLLSNYLLALPVAKIPALPNPPIPDNLFTSPFAADPTLSLPAAVQPNSNGVINVPVLLDHRARRAARAWWKRN